MLATCRNLEQATNTGKNCSLVQPWLNASVYQSDINSVRDHLLRPITQDIYHLDTVYWLATQTHVYDQA